MSVNMKDGVMIWVFAFLTFLGGLGTVASVVMWAVKGADSTISFLLVGNTLPSWTLVNVTVYFWLSLIFTFVLLGVTCFLSTRRPPLGPKVQAMVAKVEDEMVATRGTLEATRISLFARDEEQKMARQEMMQQLKADMNDIKNEMAARLEKMKAEEQENQRKQTNP